MVKEPMIGMVRNDGGTMWSAYNAATWWSTHGQTRQGSSYTMPSLSEKRRFVRCLALTLGRNY